MPDFDYANARLRAMKSRLLPRRTLEGLARVGSVQGLITALTNTSFREAVEAALVRLTGMDCLAEALRNDLVATVGKARGFFTGAPGALAALALRRYDAHNVKAILRGLAQQAPADEILAGTLPVAELRPADLVQLARAADFRAAIDLLATWRVPLARPLLALRGQRRDGRVEVPEMELALDRWRMHTALRATREAGTTGRPLNEALRLEADATNILTVLRLVSEPDEMAMIRAAEGRPSPRLATFAPPGAADVTQLLIGPGQVAFELLARAARRESVAAAIDVLEATPYGALLSETMDTYADTARLSAFERALAQRQLRHAASLVARDPLGIGVLLGYVALKTNEVANLRAVAQGLLLGEKPGNIRTELMFVGD